MTRITPNNRHDEHVVRQATLARELGITVERQRYRVRRAPHRRETLRAFIIESSIAVVLAAFAVAGFLDVTTR
jgi:hypothetical protein